METSMFTRPKNYIQLLFREFVMFKDEGFTKDEKIKAGIFLGEVSLLTNDRRTTFNYKFTKKFGFGLLAGSRTDYSFVIRKQVADDGRIFFLVLGVKKNEIEGNEDYFWVSNDIDEVITGLGMFKKQVMVQHT